MDIFGALRQRIGGVIAAVLGGICFFGMGGFFAFFLSPQQAVEWRRIEALPELTAATYGTTASRADVAVTGKLKGNTAIGQDGLVAYVVEQWDVTTPSSSSSSSSSSDNKPSGSWKRIETHLPALSIALPDGTVKTTETSSAAISGSLHEFIKQGTGSQKATYNNQSLPEGSLRTQGFTDGDLITAVGKKGADGGLQPDHLYAGDRAGLVNEIRTGAQIMFWVGLAMMACSPVVLIGGIWGAIFGRSRATGGLGGVMKGLKIG
jgi:hypothetical protein